VNRKTEMPRRMCMGCAERAPQNHLIRVGRLPDGQLGVVSQPRHAGRTGYLHSKQLCWETFAARKGFVRSLGFPLDKAMRLALVASLQRAERSAMLR
jgi:predicted RNA-binding protein YlxR (DUF448 family)